MKHLSHTHVNETTELISLFFLVRVTFSSSLLLENEMFAYQFVDDNACSEVGYYGVKLSQNTRMTYFAD